MVYIRMFTTGARKIQIAYCGHYSFRDMRIRLSISEMSMRIVPLQDLQTFTSESGNNIFFFTSTLDGGECSASRLRLFIPYEESTVCFPFGTWLGGPQDMYRRFAKVKKTCSCRKLDHESFDAQQVI
jgi:hypothetical protein